MLIGVFGCVASPGERELCGTRVSVARAIREAGGTNPNLATGIVTVKLSKRGGRSKYTVARFNVRKSARRAARTYLRPGSVVVVQFNGSRLLRAWQNPAP